MCSEQHFPTNYKSMYASTQETEAGEYEFLLCSPGSVPAPDSQVLGLQVWTTVHSTDTVSYFVPVCICCMLVAIHLWGGRVWYQAVFLIHFCPT